MSLFHKFHKKMVSRFSFFTQKSIKVTLSIVFWVLNDKFIIHFRLFEIFEADRSRFALGWELHRCNGHNQFAQ